MRKLFKKLSALVLCSTLLMASFFPAEAYAADNKEFRGVWISTVYSSDYPSVQNDVAGQKAEFIEKLDILQANGFNAVFVQVRPKGDAFYKSDLNPWSSVLTGVQGKDPGYDPMAFMIEEAHKRGMEFHAWLNPYRITTSGTDLSTLSADNMARQNPDWILTYNNAMYYNPAKEAVKQYVTDTVAEIIENYDVDGIHFDDYFYPSNYPLPDGETRDGATANERREHVNELIEMVSKKVNSLDSSVDFGISPMGIWKNSTSDPAGSNTRGSEGYYTVSGDAKVWIEKGWVDYVAPQIYWEKGNAYADYETLVKWWSDLVKNTNVKLYIGQGIYKDVVASEIIDQMKINEKYDVRGSIFFSAKDIFDNRQGAATALKAYYTNTGTSTEPSEPTTPTIIEKKLAYASKATVTVNDNLVAFETYVIDDYTYFKLRDISYSVSGTEKQFDTIWSELTTSINLLTNNAYSGSAPAVGAASGNATAITSTAKLTLDSVGKNVSAFTIHDYTYYKLRDIAKLLDIGVTWDEASGTIGIDTRMGY